MRENRYIFAIDYLSRCLHISGLRVAVAAWAACLNLVGCGPLTVVVGLSPGDQRLDQTVVEPADRWFSPRVAIVDVSGMIHGGAKQKILGRGENPVSMLHEKLEKAHRDNRVKAVILRLNTPGGTVTASDAMYRTVHRFKRQSQKPVVALMMDVAASGGYYLACSADKVVAYPTSVTGSIGVIMQTISLKPALTRLGIQAEAFTTGPNKDAGSPLSLMTDEHRTVFQSLVDDFYRRFLDVVRRARPSIPADRFDQVTDGRILTGQEAAGVGLVDQTGDLYDAFDLAKQLAGTPDADLVLYHRPLDYVASPYATMPGHPISSQDGPVGHQINLFQLNLPDTLVQAPVEFYYLWQPQLP